MASGFERDLDVILERLGLEGEPAEIVLRARNKLVDMWRQRLVKSNHSVMLLVIAGYLASKGFMIDVEVELEPDLRTDVLAEWKGRRIIVEIETGYVPPSHSVDPLAYRAARETYKIAKYSPYADIFVMATPPYHVLQVPEPFLNPPEVREKEDLMKVKALVDRYYKNPPISLEELSKAHLDYVYMVNVDVAEVYDLRSGEYLVRIVKPLYAGMSIWKELI